MNDTRPAIFVIDDDAAVRRAIARLLRAAGMEVIVCASAQAYLDQFDPARPGCLILDLAMPAFNGLQLQVALTARGNAPPIIFLTGHAQVPDSVQAMKHGAADFLTKPVDEEALLESVCSAVGKDRIDRRARAELADIQRRFATLTARELQVLACVVAGKLNKQTAAELGTVEKTVKVHRAHIMEKIQAQSLAELVHLATRAGITTPPWQ